MASEQSILAAIANSGSAYKALAAHLKAEDFTDPGQLVLREIKGYYRTDPEAVRVDLGLLAERVKRHGKTAKQADMLADVVAGLKGELSPLNVAQEYLALRREAVGVRLANALISGAKREVVDELLEDYTKWNTALSLDDGPRERVEADIIKMMGEELDPAKRVPILPAILRDKLDGGVHRGDCVVVFGRPNSGKSTFCINATSGFLRSGLRVLWIENEDRANKTRGRVLLRLLQMNKLEWMKDPEGSLAKSNELGYGNFIYEPVYPGSVGEIEALVQKHKPDVFVVNQVRNLVVKAGSKVEQLDVAANRLRSIGKKHDAVTFLVTQARDGGFEKPVLYMEDVDSSHTGIPAAADLMIGVGITRDLRRQNMTCLSVCKNKASTYEDHFYVKVDPLCDKLISQRDH